MGDLDIKENYSLASLNTLGLKVSARYFTEATHLDQVISAVGMAEKKGLELLVLGAGSNLVFSGDFTGLVLKIGLQGIEYQGNRVTAHAGENWHNLVVNTLSNNLFGLENLSLIPGTVGAAPVQNIGAYGVELESLFDHLLAFDRQAGELVTFKKKDCLFGYRNSIFKSGDRNRYIIISVTLRLNESFQPQLSYPSLANRLPDKGNVSAMELSNLVSAIRREKLPYPDEIGNVGSFFKNPIVSRSLYERISTDFPAIPAPATGKDGNSYKLSAAWMIENCGLKGLSEGGASVSRQHALVIVNRQDALPGDILNLSRQVIDRVKDRFGIELELEPQVR